MNPSDNAFVRVVTETPPDTWAALAMVLALALAATLAASVWLDGPVYRRTRPRRSYPARPRKRRRRLQ